MTYTALASRTTSSPARTRLMAILAGAVGLIHLVLVPEYLEEKPYVGWLFLAGGLMIVAATILGFRAAGTPRAALAWAAAATVAAGMFVGGVASRTTGLPDGFHPQEWEPMLVVSLVLEVVYLAVWSTTVRRQLT